MAEKKKQTLAQRKKKDREKARKTVTKNAEVAREILSDPKYPTFRARLKKGSRDAAVAKAVLLRQKGGDTQERMIELRMLQFKEDFFEDFANDPQNWLMAERNMKAEEKVEKRYKTGESA